MAHGYAKVLTGPERFVDIVHAMSSGIGTLMAWATIISELVRALAVLLGAFVPALSIPMAIILLVAAVTVHLPYGLSSIKLQAVTATGAQFGQPGYEAAILYLACLAALVLCEAGSYSIDS